MNENAAEVAVVVVVAMWCMLTWGDPDLIDAISARVAGVPVTEWIELGADE